MGGVGRKKDDQNILYDIIKEYIKKNIVLRRKQVTKFNNSKEKTMDFRVETYPAFKSPKVL